jgi:hypothetical protein
MPDCVCNILYTPAGGSDEAIEGRPQAPTPWPRSYLAALFGPRAEAQSAGKVRDLIQQAVDEARGCNMGVYASPNE